MWGVVGGGVKQGGIFNAIFGVVWRKEIFVCFFSRKNNHIFGFVKQTYDYFKLWWYKSKLKFEVAAVWWKKGVVNISKTNTNVLEFCFYSFALKFMEFH